jgi:hypothetical protein
VSSRRDPAVHFGGEGVYIAFAVTSPSLRNATTVEIITNIKARMISSVKGTPFKKK